MEIKLIILTLFLLHSAPGVADIPANYYSTANATNATTLRNSLNDIITAGHVQIGYDNTWEPMEQTDEDHG
jgi:hypothetical protein